MHTHLAEKKKRGFNRLVTCLCVFVCVSHQQTVEEDMDKHPQAADDEVKEVVEELKVHHHRPVAPRKCAAIPHKTDQEDDFVTYLKGE